MNPWTSVLVLLLTASCGASTESDERRAPGTVALVGVWHSCAAHLSFEADGTWTYHDEKAGCDASGSWLLDGDRVDLSIAPGNCESAPTAATGVQVVRNQSTLALVYPSGKIAAFLADSAPRTRYRLSGQGGDPPVTGESILRIVGDDASGYRSACYWSADGACGGLLSCNGSVEQWQVQDQSLIAKLGCGGGCPCAAILEGKEDAAGALSGTFLGADCNHTFEGTFQAEPLKEP